MARRDKHHLGRALAISAALHGVVLSLQFGLPGKGWPQPGWDWGMRKASVPPPSLRVELRAGPVEAVVVPLTPQPVVRPLAAERAAPAPTPTPMLLAPSTGAISAQLLPAPHKPVRQIAPQQSTAPVRKRQKTAGGTPVLSVKKEADDGAWRITAAAEDARVAQERSARAAVKTETETEIETETETRIAPSVQVLRKEVDKVESQAMQQVDARETQRIVGQHEHEQVAVEQPHRELPVRQRAEEEQGQLAMQSETERIAAQALARQLEDTQARAQLQAEVARRKAEEDKQMQKAAEEAALAEASALRRRGEMQAEEQRRRAQEMHERAEKAALARAEAAAEAQRRLEMLAAEEKRQAEAALRLLEEQRRERQHQEELQALRQAEAQRQAQAAALASAQEEERANAAELARAQAQARAAEAAEAARMQREQAAAMARTANAASNVTPGAQAAPALGGASLASRALEMARRSLPGPGGLSLKPPVADDTTPEPSRHTSFLGRNPAEIQLSFYGDSWEEKIRRIARVNYPRLPRSRAYGAMVVSVSIKSDGSLAGISILQSSGSAELDAAARRIIEMSAPFAAFPANLRRIYDVVEIRRTLSFAEQPPLDIRP